VDGDGWGTGAAVLACTRPAGHAPQDGDCDDLDPAVHPGVVDDCDGVDDDCDDQVDEDAEERVWYGDADGDGYGDLSTTAIDCARPDGYVADATDIDEACLEMIALRQPAAADLRFITAAMKINTDMERIGDQAINIAESAEFLLTVPPVKPLIDIPRMAEVAKEMLRDSLDAFVHGNDRLAYETIKKDDIVDQLKDQVFRELLTYMISDPETIRRALSLILVSRHLERVADHATNICEDVIFMVKGKDIRHQDLLP
jgi:phosphate transport system protein